MKWNRVPLGPLQTNCYWIEKDQTVLLFDPGEEGGKLVKHFQQQGLKVAAILLTHAHFDHIGAVDTVKEAFNCPVYLHEKEKNWLTNASLNGSERFGLGKIECKEGPTNILTKEQVVELEGIKLNILHTPGHSPGSVSFYCKELGIVIAGDTLFQQGIGRTDLYGGSMDVLMKSIHTKLLTLPEDTVVLSGHGNETTIGWEMEENPYLNGF